MIEELKIGYLLIPKDDAPMMVINKIPVDRFEFKEGTSNKFWEIFTHGREYTTRWGRIGTRGQSQTKSFGDEADCEKAAQKITDEKLNEGYKRKKVENSYIYSFSNPSIPGKKHWLSFNDLEPYIKKFSATIQRTKV